MTAPAAPVSPSSHPARRFAAEFEPTAVLVLVWPDAGTDWAGMLLPHIQAAYVRMIAEVARDTQVLVLVRDIAARDDVIDRLLRHSVHFMRVEFALLDYNDTWVRDYGPLSVLEHGRVRWQDFRFNGWGGKFAAAADDGVTQALLGSEVVRDQPCDRLDLILEGGAIETDGQGTALLRRSAVLTETRNPGLDQAGLEAALARHLGIRRCLWLEHGQIPGDDTDGHIDTLVRFVRPDTLAYVSPPAEGHPAHAGLAAMRAELEALRQENGEPYRLIALPYTEPAWMRERDAPLPCSYANFVLCNGRLFLPTYGDGPDDVSARTLLKLALPEFEVVPMDARVLITQGGGWHCATLQIPEPFRLHVPPPQGLPWAERAQST